jgi:hypothetical protein
MRAFNFNLTWAIPAAIAIAAIWGVSACANWYAGASFGDSSVFDFLLFQTTTSQIFSSASLSADILKTVMLFAATAALATRNFKAAGVTGGIWFVCTVWSVISATGFVAFNQGNVTDGRGKSVANWSHLEKQLERNEQRRAEVKPHRPQKAVQAEIDGILRIPGIDGCAVINGPVTRLNCPRLTSLWTELAYAESAIWLDSELDRLRKELKSEDRVTSENPWADLVAGLTTATASQAMTGRALLFAFMLELISGPGFWALWVAYASTLKARPVTAHKPQEDAPAVVTEPALQDDVVVQEAPQPPVTPPTGPKPGSRALGDMAKLTAGETAPDDTVQPENNVVTLYDPPVNKRDEKRRKKEIIDRQNRALVSAYVDERLDTTASSAQIVLTKKAGHQSGGTAGGDIYADFRRWCRDNNENPVGKNHFGRFVGEFVDRARNSKGVVYGAVILQPAAKRKAA